MSLSMYQASVPAFTHALGALDRIIDKAIAHCAARKIDPQALLTARLYPDMFPFARQVFVAADFAKNTPARLAGVEAPKYPDEEKTFEELKARLAKTIAYANGFTPARIDGSEEREITIPIGGNPRTFKGQQYLVGFALPNFYFHLTTAYAILRHNGVEIGKRDFLGAA
jgi:hypothetical protein